MADGVNIDWSLASQPNFAQAALSGFQAGHAIGKERAIQQAMTGLDVTKPETLGPLLRADPATGAALLSASIELHKAQTDAASKSVLTDYLLARDKARGGAALTGGAGGSVAPSPAAPVPSFLANPGNPAATAQAAMQPPAPAAPTATADPNGDPNGDIVVTAQNTGSQPSPLEAARTALMQSDPEKFIDLQSKIGAMDKADRERVDDASSTLAAMAQSVKMLPYEQRGAYIQQHKSELLQHGLSEAQISGFDPTDQNIAAETNQALGVKGILEQQDKDRTFGLSSARFGEEQRHNRTDEGQGAARIGIAAGQLGVAKGHLALDQKAAAGKAGAAGGGISTPTNAAEYNSLPADARYYKNGVIRVKQ